ncbi:YigZ family protein [Dyella sp. A6]|uniref:IMPACT family protein n=1 Tax=Dyella aluminiiresistens TaxID=3069105 RepID=UPI002E799B7F|nr:YigZ family protein [Dyella sp. A6]
MSDLPRTLVCASQHELDVRKSRFLAQAAPVESRQQAQAFMDHVSDPAATHNCWAWRIGSDYRFNDDGEPGGTAGRPILQAIESQGIDRVVVVVTRWYGGIKLGAGGLARAYGGTAAECLRLAEQRPIIDMTRIATRCSFAELELFKARLAELDAEIEQGLYEADGVALQIRLPSTRLDEARVRIADMSRGRSQVIVLD